MSVDRLVEFRYSDLVNLERSGRKPRGYVAEVMRHGKKRWGSVIMTADAYQHLVKKFEAQEKPAAEVKIAELPRKSSIIVPRKPPTQLLGPTGKPLAKSCCGQRK